MWRKLVAGVLFTGGTVMGLGILATAGSGHPLAATVAAWILTSGAPLALGGWLIAIERRRARALAAKADADDERALLRLAATRGGHLTAVEVVASTSIDAARAERLLDGLCRRGLAEHRIAENGSLVYRVQALLGTEEKARAKSVLDA